MAGVYKTVSREQMLKSPDTRRSTLHVLLLHMGIRIQYLLDSWFFLKPIFAHSNNIYKSPVRPEGIPEIDYPTAFAMRMIWLIGSAFRAYKIFLFIAIKLRFMHALNWCYLRLGERIARKMESSGFDWEKGRAIQIPEYDWKNGNPQEFYETYIKTGHPVVLRGFMKNSTLTEEFTFDKLVEKFGEEDVLLTTKEMDGQLGKLKEVVKPKYYLHNSEVLFRKYPEIWDALELQKLNPYMGPQRCGYAQLFVGRQGTGTPFHMASNVNMFYMIDGTKRWYFHDPYDIYTAGAIWSWGAAAALFLPLYPDDYDPSALPAYKYCPYYTTDVHAGDVLYNPAWWPHAIRNITDKTAAIASRWLHGGKVGSNLRCPEEDYDINRMGSFIFMSGPKSYPFVHEILYEPSPSYDEHSTLREKNVRFTHMQWKIAKGEINVDGWRPLF